MSFLSVSKKNVVAAEWSRAHTEAGENARRLLTFLK
jgi:hypothetical protein